jgi:gliding motility-associated lipoprotein GldH
MNVIFSFTKNNFLRIISAGALLFIIASAFISCDDKMMYEENREIKDNTWDMKNQLSFDFDVPDTNTKYNFYFNVRNTDDYPYSNIYVFFHTKFPNGKMGNDTVEFPLADDQGHWYGKGQGDLYDCRLIFRQGVRFPLAGKYHMDIEQAMRMEQLPGIQSAGIRIERAE